MKLRVKVGSYYLNRRDELIRIKDEDCDDESPFNDENGFSYSRDGCSYSREGKFYHHGSEFDLIKEVRVAIEEVEPVSEFYKLKINLVRFTCYGLQKMTTECIQEWIDGMDEEIERLQKLFEGDKE